MKHLGPETHGLPADKILSNWATASTFIYGPVTTDCLKQLLRHEVLNKDRSMIIERLTVRLLSVMKSDLRIELHKDIKELHGIRKEH